MMRKRANAKVTSRWEPLPENASTMQVMLIPEVDEQPFHFEDMPKQDLINFSKYIDQSNRTLETENMIIERYLMKADPNALARMSRTLKAAAVGLKKIEKLGQIGTRPSVLSVSKDTSESKSTFCSSSDSQRTGTTTSGSGQAESVNMGDRKQKVQPLQKIEIVNGEINELKGILENFKKKVKKFNYDLKCRNEELSARLAEITQAQFTFDYKLLVDDLDPMTGALPGEKFLKYLEKRIKEQEMEVNRLRIKTGCSKNLLKRLNTELLQKKEIAEELDMIDFEQLKVENRESQEILEEKIFHLAELKKTSKRFENIFSVDKEKLEEQMTNLAHLQQIIASKNKLIERLEQSEERMDSDITVASHSLGKIKSLMKSYVVPDVMDYIEKKVEENKLKKDIKMKKRQIKLKDMMLTHQRNLYKRYDDISKTDLSFSSVN